MILEIQVPPQEADLVKAELGDPVETWTVLIYEMSPDQAADWARSHPQYYTDRRAD